MHSRPKGTADHYWPWAVFKILKSRQGSGPEGDDVLFTQWEITITIFYACSARRAEKGCKVLMTMKDQEQGRRRVSKWVFYLLLSFFLWIFTMG